MKFDLSKFKKVKISKDAATMKHPDGHVITVALKSLHPKMREQFHALPMADGGEVQDYEGVEPSEAKGSQVPVREMVEIAAAPVPTESPVQQALDISKDRMRMQAHPDLQGPRLDLLSAAPAEQQVAQNALGMASAGTMSAIPSKASGILTPAAQEAKAALNQAMAEGAPLKVIRQLMNKFQVIAGRFPGQMADGGEVSKEEDKESKIPDESDIKFPQHDPHNQIIEELKKKFPSYNYGGEVNSKTEESEKLPHYAEGSLDGVEGTPDAVAEKPISEQLRSDIDALNAPTPDQVPQMSDMSEAPQSEVAKQQAPQPSDNPSADLIPQMSSDLMHGYQSQMQGIQSQAAAEGQLGAQQAQDLQAGMQRQQKLQQDFQQSYDNLNNERLNLMDDIKNGLVDPNKYWENHSKVAAGIGIILAGINPSGTPNAALNFLNHQIDRSIQAQAANLSAKNNLLSANLHQFGNMRDAVNMTKIMQSDILSNQLKMEAARATDPLVKARALQAAGQLEMQVAPMMMQMNMRQALIKSGHDGQQSSSMRHEDPASYVPFVVPKEHQEAVYKEIERAQDTRRMGKSIMEAFDQAAKDNTILKTGAGFLRTPASVLALHQAMQPTFKDLEGTVRQAAMDNTFKNITPQPGNMESTIATKRNALQDYIRSKESAPRAKSFNIDLDKFASTNITPEGRLSPQQQQFLDWARSNPQDPRSAMILQKLKIRQ